MAIATPKEIQELDVSVLLQMESWKYEDQFELDLINLYKYGTTSFSKYTDVCDNMQSLSLLTYRDPETLSNSSYLVVQSPTDRKILENVEKPQKGSHSLVSNIFQYEI